MEANNDVIVSNMMYQGGVDKVENGHYLQRRRVTFYLQ